MIQRLRLLMQLLNSSSLNPEMGKYNNEKIKQVRKSQSVKRTYVYA